MNETYKINALGRGYVLRALPCGCCVEGDGTLQEPLRPRFCPRHHPDEALAQLARVRDAIGAAQNMGAEGGTLTQSADRRYKAAQARLTGLLAMIEDVACPGHNWKPYASGALRRCATCKSIRTEAEIGG